MIHHSFIVCTDVHMAVYSFWDVFAFISRIPFYYHSLALILAWMNNHMPSKMWNNITYRFPNFNGTTVEVWEWIINIKFIPHFIMDVINGYLSMLGLKLLRVS